MPVRIISDTGTNYIALHDETQRLVKLLSCVDCGPVTGNICAMTDQIPYLGQFSSNLIYIIGGEAERGAKRQAKAGAKLQQKPYNSKSLMLSSCITILEQSDSSTEK